MKKYILSVFAFAVLFFIFSTQQITYANTYNECETGQYTACNTNGSNTGQVMSVTNNNGSYTCNGYSAYKGYKLQSASPQCVRQICNNVTKQYNECGDNTGGPCDNSNRQELIVVTYCQTTNRYYCYNEGPQPGCGEPNVTPSTSPSPSPSPSPSSGPNTVAFKLIVGLPGIGYNGPVGVTPKHNTRSVTVTLYAAGVAQPSGPGTTPLTTPTTGKLTYDSGSDNNAGYFVGTLQVALPAKAPANNAYEILVQIPQYLYKLAVNAVDSTTTFPLTAGGSATSAPLIPLYPGDVAVANGGQNHFTGDDYTVMLNCFNNASSCPTTTDGIPLADLDDNGTINIIDLNLWLRSLYQLQQAQAPGCSSADCQGD